MTCGDKLYKEYLVNQNPDDPCFQGYLTGFHQICQDTYESMVKGYFDGNMPPPVVKTPDELIRGIGVLYEYDENVNLTTNDGLTVTPLIPNTPDVRGTYSIAHFKGIMNVYNPHELHFSKAFCSNDFKKTVVMQAIGKDENGEDIVVYYGDLSDVYP